ncbi:hypothetical protein ALP75_200590 [Pseudomonas syringae pv. actinidiae]|nr:hypothetical protein ALP75_200590 [Pseudomonas syringae pv. actinidiae]
MVCHCVEFGATAPLVAVAYSRPSGRIGSVCPDSAPYQLASA